MSLSTLTHGTKLDFNLVEKESDWRVRSIGSELIGAQGSSLWLLCGTLSGAPEESHEDWGPVWARDDMSLLAR